MSVTSSGADWRSRRASSLWPGSRPGRRARLATADQSLFGDELSTYFIISTHGLGGTIATVHNDIEITPPLSFALAWLSTRAGMTTELLRAPALSPGRRRFRSSTRSGPARSDARRASSPPRSPRSPRS